MKGSIQSAFLVLGEGEASLVSTLGCPRGAEEQELRLGVQEVMDHGAVGGGPLRAKAGLVLAPQESRPVYIPSWRVR